MAFSASEVLGFDPYAPSFNADPYAQYRSLRAGGPLRRTERGLWLTTSYEVCATVLRDQRFGHGTSGPRRSFLVLDPPEHTRLRRLVSRAFTARLVERLRPRVAALVDELLSPLAGPVDLIAALAHPLPVIVISEMLGVPPEDRDRFTAWSNALARGLDPEFLMPPSEVAARDRARAEFATYFTELATRRRAAPSDDLFSALAAVEELSTSDLIATCVLLLVAGHETTVNLIGNGTLALLRDPEQLAWFRENPSEVAGVVEELLRYDPPVQFSGRVALEDAEVAGQRIRAGEFILLLLAAAHRDPEVFPDPDRLDLTRWTTANASRHLAFGQGIHFCLGAPLARLEGQIALSKLVERDISLIPGPLPYRDNLILRGLERLPVHLS